MERLQTLLHKENIRVTSPRKAVFETLLKSHTPLSIREITSQTPTVERTSIYRCLDLFEKLGIIDIIHTGWKKRYELAGPFKPHHHHIQCTNCHKLTEIESQELERLISRISSNLGYHMSSHHFEVHGVCGKCRVS